MAKISEDVMEAVRAGYVAEQNKPHGQRTQNPHYFSSLMWEAFEVGCEAAILRESVENAEKGRGNTWRLAAGSVLKLIYTKAGSIYFERVA